MLPSIYFPIPQKRVMNGPQTYERKPLKSNQVPLGWFDLHQLLFPVNMSLSKPPRVTYRYCYTGYCTTVEFLQERLSKSIFNHKLYKSYVNLKFLKGQKISVNVINPIDGVIFQKTFLSNICKHRVKKQYFQFCKDNLGANLQFFMYLLTCIIKLS